MSIMLIMRNSERGMNMKLTDNEKLDLINTMEFVDSDADCEGILYVLVEDNEENRDILHKIGLTDEDIKEECFVEYGMMDISMVAFRYSNYYNSKKNIFYNKDERFLLDEDSKEGNQYEIW